ncbi:hypothetical protein AJ80_00629 [Polytolypa hystricis UAMH7299]|uniref:Uncharacterized protein n=1 Tax=Polytolypa hystricis (strain UAMH7299) TaxID=1447883 RepID=A0A2B7Z111_POLH7|nr:hypothetical protein AJ80_00629 [Polytolypa hystricis UAMH7299]
MPSEQDFTTLSESVRGVWGHGRLDTITKRFPNHKDRSQYFGWLDKKLTEQLKRTNTPVPRKQLIEMINNVNYADKRQSDELAGAMSHSQWAASIAVGRSKTQLYRFVAGAYELRPDDLSPITDSQLAPEHILGINCSNVHPRGCPMSTREAAEAAVSEEPTQSGESDDDGDDDVARPEFTFQQLGRLEFTSAEDVLGGGDPPIAFWVDSGFALVERFNDIGQGCGLYIIYDFYPTAIDGEREAKYSGENWGQWPGCPIKQPFSVARIADSIKELHFGYELKFTDIAYHPVELVRVVRSPTSTITRSTVE